MEKHEAEKTPVVMCARCERKETDHLLVNYADGPYIGRAVLVCPIFVFVPGRRVEP